MDLDRAKKYAEQVMNVLGQDELSREEVSWIQAESLRGFKDHINPGFLEYRKAVSTDYTALEWVGSGTRLSDVTGREFLDCLGGYGTYSFGHRHPVIIDAVRHQMSRLTIHSQELIDPPQALAARLLSMLTPGDLKYTFFSNSGSEAVEGALKLARLHTGRTRFIAANMAFHGKSLGALSATGRKMWRKPFLPLIPGFVHVPFGDAAIIETILAVGESTGDEVAAVILEPLQGEGGVWVPPDDYFHRVKEICQKYGTLLIMDEVQTGLGRTGEIFGCDHYSVVPDIMCLGKALGGGVMPVSAFTASEEVWQGLIPNPVLHTSTFGGNPLAATAVIAAIRVLLDERLWENARKAEEYMLPQLREIVELFPGICVDVRGKGLLLGMEFSSDEIGYAVSRELFARGVLVAGTTFNARVIRIEPPLTITREEQDIVIDRFCQAVAAVSGSPERRSR